MSIQPFFRAPNTARAAMFITCGALVALYIAARCVYLDADPPLQIGGHSARELFAEPPAKSHEARNWALFGAFRTNPADGYQFWRAQSPCWVYPLAGFFRVFGADYPQLRVFSALYSACGFAVLLLLAWQYFSPRVAVVFGLLMLGDAGYVHYSRVGLLEPAVSAWCAVALLCVLRAREHPGWLVLALLGFAAAFFTKQAAVHVVPALAIGIPLSQWHARDELVRRRGWLLTFVLLCAVLLVGSWLHMRGEAYTRALELNVDKYLAGGGADEPPQTLLEQAAVWGHRWVAPRRYQQLARLMPLTAPIAAVTSAVIVLYAVRRRRLQLPHLMITLWFLGAWAAVMVLATTSARFWSLLVPPAALLTAVGTDAAARWSATRARAGATAVVLSVLGTHAGLHATTFTTYLFEPAFTLREAAATLERALGPERAVVVGFQAPELVLGTPYLNYYVRDEFNKSPATLRDLHITHALLVEGIRDYTREIIEAAYPGLLPKLAPSLQLSARGQRYNLYNVKGRFKTRSDRHVKQSARAARVD